MARQHQLGRKVNRRPAPAGKNRFPSGLAKMAGIFKRWHVDSQRPDFLVVDHQPHFLIEVHPDQPCLQTRLRRGLLQIRQQFQRRRDQLHAFRQSRPHHAAAPFILQHRTRSAIDIRLGQRQTRRCHHHRHITRRGRQHRALGDPFEFDPVHIDVGPALQQQGARTAETRSADQQRTLVRHAETFAEIVGQHLGCAFAVAPPFDAQTAGFRLVENEMHEQILARRRRQSEGHARRSPGLRDRRTVHPSRHGLRGIERQIRRENLLRRQGPDLRAAQTGGEQGPKESGGAFHWWGGLSRRSFKIPAGR